ncbi:hypothetical protein F4781DRAFT_442076 [Annulohypoxylon bovei var. microspora]|nr:hypothetical protein F4781DRAFT_442076 [Annulohypoxylon bovei var. microspora]
MGKDEDEQQTSRSNLATSQAIMNSSRPSSSVAHTSPDSEVPSDTLQELSTSSNLPPLRPSQPSIQPSLQPPLQPMRPGHDFSPDDLEAASILACIFDEEEERNESALAASTDTMSQQGAGGAESPKRRSSDSASMKKYIASVNRAVGGPPSKDASRKDWDQYVNKFMTENWRRGDEEAENSWTELEKSEGFIKKMGQQRFRLLGNNSDEDELPKTIQSTTPAKQGGQVERNRVTPKKDSKKGARQEKQVGENRQHAPNAKAQVTKPATASPTTLPHDPDANGSLADAPQAQTGKKTKRRRTGLEILQSSLGKNWEPMVDEEGHRPTRKAKKN